MILRSIISAVAFAVVVILSDTSPATTEAAFPGHNGRIAYAGWVNEVGDIYTANLDGSAPLNLTNSDVYDDDPAWSPDGTRIVFTSYPADDPEGEIYTMNADGSEPLRLTNSPGTDWEPAWSPDGRIAFASERGGDYEIYVMDADGGNIDQLTDVDGYDGSPDWSPDGAMIAFASGRKSDSDIFIMEADGDSQEVLIPGPGYASSPSWAPDGNRIAFYENIAGNFDIYYAGADGSNKTRLTDDPARDGSPAWSPDGTQIAFESRRNEPDPKNCNDCLDLVFVMNADGSNEHLASPQLGEENDPDWQPQTTSGDTDCDHDVDSVDGLFDLRYTAALSHHRCVFSAGDVNCSGLVDAVDALFILRHVAALPVNLPDGCREIGA